MIQLSAQLPLIRVLQMIECQLTEINQSLIYVNSCLEEKLDRLERLADICLKMLEDSLKWQEDSSKRLESIEDSLKRLKSIIEDRER